MKTLPIALSPAPSDLSTGVPSVPDDLRTWLGEDELIQVVLNVVANLNPSGCTSPAARAFGSSGNSSTATTLLTVLLYAYGTGHFASDEIEHACQEDPVLRYLCGRDYPTWEVIRRFRRTNRALLRQALLDLFQAALEARDDSMNALFEGLEVPVDHEVRPAIPVSTLATAAEDMLQRAVFADSIARDI